MDGIHRAIFLWGAICLIGFGMYHPGLVDMVAYPPMIIWSVLAVIGIIGMILWVPHWQKNKVVHVWIAINVIGMIYNWLFILNMAPAIIPSVWAYWALLMAIGFVLTGHYWKDNFWYYVGALNFVAFLVMQFSPTTIGMMNQSVVLAIVSGIPTMYHGWTGK